MVCELPQLREMDINPIIVGTRPVRWRWMHASWWTTHRRRCAITTTLPYLPYPSQHEQVWPMRGGGEYTVRPIHPDDASMLQEFVRKLSPESRYFRFVSSIQELPPTMLSRFTLIDYDREMALVAVCRERSIGCRRRDPWKRHACWGCRATSPTPTGQAASSRWWWPTTSRARAWVRASCSPSWTLPVRKALADIEGLVLANNTNMLKLMKGLGFAIKAFPGRP